MLEFENTSMPLENSRAEPLGFQTDLYQIFLLVDWQLIMDASYKSVSKAVYFLPYLRVHLKKKLEDTTSELFYVICLILWHLFLQGNAYQ